MGLVGHLMNAGRKIIGRIGPAVKHIGRFAAKAGKFIADNHQPLAMIANGIGEATGHPVAKNIGAAAMIGSGLLSAGGVGKDYIGVGGTPARIT
jgi:hypothetical protein